MAIDGNRVQSMVIIECNWRIQSNGMVAYFDTYIASTVCFMQPSTISAIAEYNPITMASCYPSSLSDQYRALPTRA